MRVRRVRFIGLSEEFFTVRTRKLVGAEKERKKKKKYVRTVRGVVPVVPAGDCCMPWLPTDYFVGFLFFSLSPSELCVRDKSRGREASRGAVMRGLFGWYCK